MLGLGIWVLARVAVGGFDLSSPWTLVVYVAVALFTLMLGTIWLVPWRSRVRTSGDR